MNKLAMLPAEPIATVEEFADLCHDYATWWRAGVLEKLDAVDCVQGHAELWGIIDHLGQDEVQRLMAEVFMPAVELPSDYSQQLLMRWELDDERDRWRWTGELPPKPDPQPEWPLRKPYETPQATIDAFFYVVSTGSSDYLADWLAQHPLDAPHLHKLWKAKCSTAPAT